MANTDIIIKIATSLGKALGGSSDLFSEFDTEHWGVHLPASILQAPSVKNALHQASVAADNLEKATVELEPAILDENKVEIIKSIIAIVTELKSFVTAVKDLVQIIENETNVGSIPDSTTRALVEDFLASFSRKIIDNIIIVAIENYIPRIMLILKILGLVDWKYSESEHANNLFTGYVKKTLHLERIKDLISDPASHFNNTIGWGSNSFDPEEFFRIFTEFFDEEDYIYTGVEDGDPFLRKGDFLLKRNSDVSPPGLQFNFVHHFEQTETFRSILSEYLGMNFSAMFGLSGGITLNISPPFNFELLPPAGEISGDAKVFIDINEDKKPLTLVGDSNDLIQLKVDNLSAGVGLYAAWDIVKGKAILDPMLFAEIKNATLQLGSSDADSFIGNLLSNADIEGSFDLGLEWLFSSGLRIKASGGIEIALPIHKRLAIIEITTIYLSLKIKNDGSLSFEASSGLNGTLGPLTASVERIGALADLKFSGDDSSDFGLFDFDFKFKPPSGVGLAIDAGVVKGGGYLFFDFDKEEYAGALELTFSDFLSLKAIGLVTTRMPDGSKGFSLIIIITAEFTIQLGYGFVFLGAGGLLGLHRTMKLEPLAEGVRTGATVNIMFPSNIVENAPKIISDLRVFFPVEEGMFLIGPIAKLGWGTPVIISISLGIMIEIRVNNGGGIERIAILGVLKCILPDEDAALLVLQVNFIGAIDFQKKYAFFFASIFDSRILFITIEGEMGVLVAWGEESDFVVSVGGFHPRFNPPPLPFPVPKRVSLNILNESWGKIRVEGYFAVTTNTAQFGAKIEVWFGFSEFKIEGNLAFDALFQFNPFYFIIEISGKVSLKVFGFDLFTISLKLSLEGTSPWRAAGYGKIKILFFTFKAKFDKTWGESKNTQLPPIQIIPILRNELENIQNWQAVPPVSNNLLVTLRKLPLPEVESEKILAFHPLGILRISQRAVPLRITINKVGSQKPDDASKLDFEPSGDFVPVGVRKESFARAQFQNMDDSKKLSSPSYEKEAGGFDLSVSGDQMRFGRIAVRHVRYELITIDTGYKRFRNRFFNWMQVLFVHFLANNAARRSSVSYRIRKEYQPFDEKIKVIPGAYTVVNTKDNKPYNTEAVNFTSMASAEEYMNGILTDHTLLADSIHVIPNNEINTIL